MPQQNFKNKSNQNIYIYIYTVFRRIKLHRDCFFLYLIWGREKKVSLPLYFTKTNAESVSNSWEGREEHGVFSWRRKFT